MSRRESRARLGRVTADEFLRVRGLRGEVAVEYGDDELRQAWQGTEIV